MELLGTFRSNQDGTLKCVFKNEKQEIVEISLLNNKEYDVLCVPTHHYCNMGCKMCHLTNDEKVRPMSKVSLEELKECIYKMMIVDGVKITDKENLLISFMGVGEPLLNLDVIIELAKSNCLKSLGYKHVGYALATMMPNDILSDYIDVINDNNINLKIHYSMHSPCDSIRSKLIPGSKINVESSLRILSKYRDKITNNYEIMNEYSIFHRNSIPIEIHYTLINDVNDSLFELSYLNYFIDSYNIPIKFISFNEVGNLKKSKRYDKFLSFLREFNPDGIIKEYNPPGHDVGASCGEFTKHYYLSDVESEEESIEFENWKDAHKINVNTLKKVLHNTL